MAKPLREIVKSEATSSRIQKDWDRQLITADAVIQRFEDGGDVVLLADEVGMGKTYVALAVAARHIFQTPRNDRKVLLVVPPNSILKRK